MKTPIFNQEISDAVQAQLDADLPLITALINVARSGRFARARRGIEAECVPLVTPSPTLPSRDYRQGTPHHAAQG